MPCRPACSFARGDQAGDAAPLDELAADQVAGALGRHQGTIDAFGRNDLTEVDVEAVRAEQEVAGRRCGLMSRA